MSVGCVGEGCVAWTEGYVSEYSVLGLGRLVIELSVSKQATVGLVRELVL